MKLIDVFEFVERVERVCKNSLLEYYRTINTIINKGSNIVSKRWRDWMIDEVRVLKETLGDHDELRTEYDYVIAYFKMVISGNVSKSFSTEEVINDNDFKVNIKILEGVGDTKGEIIIEKKTQVINITIYTSSLNEIIKNSILAKKYAYKSVNDLISSVIHLLSHELTHYFQAKKNTINNDTESFIKKISGKKNLEVFRYFYYCTQPHELEALMNSAYKLYSERNSFLGDKKDGAIKRTYFRCLVYVVLSKLKAQKLANKFLVGEITLDDVCDNLREHAIFLLFWIVFCFAENDKKYKWLLKKSNDTKTSHKYNVTIMRENKEGIRKFLESLNSLGITELDNLFAKIDKTRLFDELFSTNISNLESLEELIEILPKSSFKN